MRYPTPVGGALHSAFARLGLSGALAQQRALVAWPQVVGPQIAAATRPLRVRDGILFVATRSSAWAHELIFRKAAILEGLQRELGRNTVSDIRFTVRGYQEAPQEPSSSPLPGPDDWEQVELQPADWEAVARILEPATDPELRRRLERVVIHARRVRRWQQEHGWRTCTRCGLPHAEPGERCGNCRFQGGRR